jgi:hypothetical protein
MTDYKLLVKFPTRGRPDKFFTVLDRYYYGSKRKNLTSFLITCDKDDISMNNDAVRERLQKNYRNTFVVFGESKSKIEAVNNDMNLAPEHDIILLASDDMVPEEKGYDEVIRNKMQELYPDTDGVLWFFDGYRRDFNTLCILGKKYYDRFGYIYHPSYKSFWCDNEFTDVANNLGKQTFIDKVIIRHIHPDWIQRDDNAAVMYKNVHPNAKDIGIDQTFIKNLPFERLDAQNYRQRKLAGFPK